MDTSAHGNKACLPRARKDGCQYIFFCYKNDYIFLYLRNIKNIRSRHPQIKARDDLADLLRDVSVVVGVHVVVVRVCAHIYYVYMWILYMYIMYTYICIYIYYVYICHMYIYAHTVSVVGGVHVVVVRVCVYIYILCTHTHTPCILSTHGRLPSHT